MAKKKAKDYMPRDLKVKIEILRAMEKTWMRTSRLLFFAGLFIFIIFVAGFIQGNIPLYVQIIIVVAIAAFIAAGVEFSLRARMNNMYADLLEMIDKESELKKFISLDEIPE
ncbi:MAG: hypothetical protein ACLFSQ_09980 [Candidatus Zixiibacteriota bacterium]